MTTKVSPKIWIVALSVIAMLFSALSSRSPMMSFQMMEAPSMHHGQSACKMSVLSSMEEQSPVKMDECQSEPSQHMCCDAICMTVFALLNHYQPTHLIATQLALIVRDDRSVLSNPPSSLYRPPIA